MRFTLMRSRSNSIYSYGAARDRHERIWSGDSRPTLMAILQSLPLPARTYAKNMIMQASRAISAERSLDAIDGRVVGEAWERTRTALGLQTSQLDAVRSAAE